MGYSTVPTSMFSPEMRQTPENVAKVLDIAGWTALDACMEIKVPLLFIQDAMNGSCQLDDYIWKELLDKAGRRSFDHDEDAS